MVGKSQKSDVRQDLLVWVVFDHYPVILDTIKVKWGHTPFIFENSVILTVFSEELDRR